MRYPSTASRPSILAGVTGERLNQGDRAYPGTDSDPERSIQRQGGTGEGGGSGQSSSPIDDFHVGVVKAIVPIAFAGCRRTMGAFGRPVDSSLADWAKLKCPPRRPTRNIVLAASGFVNDVSGVERRVRAVTAQNLGDGLVFDSESVVGDTIRDEADYSGVRVKIVAHLASAEIALRRPDDSGFFAFPGRSTRE